MFHRWHKILLTTLALHGCGFQDPQGTSDLDSFVWTGNKWANPSAIPVCWVNPGDTTQEVRDVLTWIVVNEFSNKSVIRFTRFDACQNADIGTNTIRVRLDVANTTFDEVTGAWSHPGGLSQIGSNPAALDGEASATMRFGAPSRWVNIPDLRNFTMSAAVHEFGHALGLRHEHQRSDRGTICDAGNGSDGDRMVINQAGNNVYVGGYDANSIMNYCRTDKAPYLTANDVGGLDYLYPDPATGNVFAATSTGNGFVGTAEKYHTFFCIADEICELADVNGDKIADLVTFTRGDRGDVYVSLGTGHGFYGLAWKWHDWFCIYNEICKVADVSGDGKADLVAFTRSNTGDVYVATSTGNGFSGTGIKWHDWFCINDEICELGDVNGDGTADLVAFTRGETGDVYIATSTGNGFIGTGQKWHDWFCVRGEICKVADINGDRKADLVTFTRSNTGDVYAALSTGAGFVGTGQKWHEWFCINDEICEVGDVSGDGKADLVAFTRSNTGDVYAATSTGSSFIGTGQKWHDWFCIGDEICKVGDINADGRADLVTFLRH